MRIIKGALAALALLGLGTEALAQPTGAGPNTSPTAQPAPPGVTQPPGGPGRGPPGPPIPTTEPRPRDDARHQGFLKEAQAGNIDLLFVGDSITDWWRTESRGKPVWDRVFAPLRAANWGIAGDTTQGVLWRMQNGELDGFQARLIVLMLGTNNLARATPAEIAAGDAMVIREFRQRQPQAKILVLGVFPRGAAPDNPYRAQIKELNYHLSHVADGKNVFFLDIGEKFLAPDGTLTREVMADGLHPTLQGYEIWADAIGGTVAEMLR